MKTRLAHRLTKQVVQALGALPAPVQRWVGGRRGQALAPEVAMLLRLMGDVKAASPEVRPMHAVRQQTDLDAWTFGGPEIPVLSCEDLSIPSASGAIPARYYVGSVHASALLVYFHGGAWVSGGLESCDPICRYLAREADLRVLSVDYRLAPEHPFPAAIDDAEAAYRFALERFASVDGKPCFTLVGGDSAGGNIAAALCLRLRDSPVPMPMPDQQLLFYPVLDNANLSESYRLFATGYVLTRAQMEWARGLYLVHGEHADPQASPLLAASLAGLPPAYVATAEFDVLRDEGEQYASRLAASAPDTQLRRANGLIHAFANMMGVSRAARAEMAAAVEAIRLAQARWQARRP